MTLQEKNIQEIIFSNGINVVDMKCVVHSETSFHQINISKPINENKYFSTHKLNDYF